MNPLTINCPCILLKLENDQIVEDKVITIYLFRYDNNVEFTIKHQIHPEKPEDVLVSLTKNFECFQIIYAIVLSSEQNYPEKLTKYGFELRKKRSLCSKEHIQNHALFQEILAKEFVQMKLNQSIPLHNLNVRENEIYILMQDLKLIDLFNNCDTWLSIPLIRLTTADHTFIKKYKKLDEFLVLHKDQNLNNIYDTLQKPKNRTEAENILEVFQLSIEFQDKNSESQKISLKRVIYLRAQSSQLEGTIRMNQKSHFISSLSNTLSFLKVDESKLVFHRELLLHCSFHIPKSSLYTENRLPCFTILNPKEYSKCENCASPFEKKEDQYGTYNFFLGKQMGVFCKKCFTDYQLQYSLKRLTDYCHFDALVSYFFINPNFSQVENNFSYSLLFKNHDKYSKKKILRAKIDWQEDNINFLVKNASSLTHVQQFVRVLFAFLFRIPLRRKYYFIRYPQIPFGEKIYPILNQIDDIYIAPLKLFDTKIYDTKNKDSCSIDTFMHFCTKENDNPTSGDEHKCNSILKYFNYSRYVGKKRKPYISFQKPDENKYQVLSWPPIEKFTTQNDYRIFFQSAKNRIQISWNQLEGVSSTFTMMIKKQIQEDEKLHKMDENVFTFSTLYFFIEKDEGKFLSVTQLSPGFLPSLTVKDKGNILERSSYMSKPKQVQSEVRTFLQQLYHENDASFFMDAKNNLQYLLKNNTVQDSLPLSIQEKMYYAKELEKNKQTCDIKYLYHYLCHVFQANIIVIQMKEKNKTPELKEICNRVMPFYLYDRFLLLVESFDDHNEEGILSFNYQAIFMKKKDGNPIYFFTENLNESFFFDLKTIYQVVYLKSKQVEYPIQVWTPFWSLVKTQILDHEGNTKFLLFHNKLLGHVSHSIPIMNTGYKFTSSATEDVPYFVSINDYKDNVQNLFQRYSYQLSSEFHSLIENKVLYHTVTIMMKEDTKLELGFIFIVEHLQEHTITRIEETKQREILFHLSWKSKKDRYFDLHNYKASLQINKEIKLKILKMYEEKRDEMTVKAFIKKHIQFVEENIFDFSASNLKVVVPQSYQSNLPYWLNFYTNFPQRKKIMEKLENQYIFSFDFRHSDNQIVQELY